MANKIVWDAGERCYETGWIQAALAGTLRSSDPTARAPAFNGLNDDRKSSRWSPGA